MSTDPRMLLVLGAAKQEQPATAYALMRELAGWGVQDWASVNPGSIYAAVKALLKDGLLVETSQPAADGRSHRNSVKYRVTDEGDSAFDDLLRDALGDVTPYRTSPFMAALCFLASLPRPEVVSILEERLSRLDDALHHLRSTEEQTVLDPEKPPHSVEFVKLGGQQIRGELVFTEGLISRIRAGRYLFVGDEVEEV
jgi:DNA-binding PadR family transcriptional regulator